MWSPFKELYHVVETALYKKQPDAVHDLEVVLRKHKPDFISLLTNPVSKNFFFWLRLRYIDMGHIEVHNFVIEDLYLGISKFLSVQSMEMAGQFSPTGQDGWKQVWLCLGIFKL